MNTYYTISIAVALAMDAMAVAIAGGISLKRVGFRQYFRLSWHFGLFQALMPVIGWSAGLTIRGMIGRFDHWLAFCLLIFVGSNMLLEAFRKKNRGSTQKDPTTGVSLVVLSVATSIDALAVGLSISILNLSIWIPALIIGITAGLFTAAGLYIGSKAVHILWIQKYAEIIGALVLYAIGISILYEHGALTILR